MKIAKVVVDYNTKSIDKIFDYLVPESLWGKNLVGYRAEVPFGGGNRRSVGYIVGVEGTSSICTDELKEITGLIDDEPLLTRERIEEAYWIKNRFLCNFSEAIRLFLPVGAGRRIDEFIALNIPAWEEYKKQGPTPNEAKLASRLINAGGRLEYRKTGAARKTINRLADLSVINISHSYGDSVGEKNIGVVTLGDVELEKISSRASAQRRALSVMKQCEFLSVSDLCMFADCSRSAVAALIKKGCLRLTQVSAARVPSAVKGAREAEEFQLTEEQQTAVDTITEAFSRPFKPVLIRGVTGSGKTEVYLRVIKKVIDMGKSAIVLVPEISLTHQMVGRFLSRFGELVAIFHSGLSDGERYDEWKRIQSGRARVVIGARSALFAPCKDLGIIVMDEEHEDSYKSESGVRYHARDVALCRAKTEGAVLVLASATPSIESYYRAKTGIYTLVEMNNRYNNVPLPSARVVDMRAELESGNRSPFSRELSEEIQRNIDAGEQTILFINRRGHSTFVSCRSCGFAAKCTNCNITLTYHSSIDRLVCHYCGYSRNNYKLCPECQSRNIRGFGTGTQKIEEKIIEEFSASVIRMDVDTTRRKESREKILDRFEAEKIDILLGTQMISKGLDFKNVSLSAVLAADQILNMGDFRAAEKTFSMITQVCGRSGRGDRRGRAIIQTYMPENKTIVYAARQDYQSFYNDEIIFRKALNYPPFCDIINIIVCGNDEQSVRESAIRLFEETKKRLSGCAEVFRAAPCRIDRINNNFRWHFWLKCRLNRKISGTLSEVIVSEKNLSVIADVNPVSM